MRIRGRSSSLGGGGGGDCIRDGKVIIFVPFFFRLRHCFQEILQQTNIEDGELRRTLQSLACGKVR